jgi:predicted amidohydrolase
VAEVRELARRTGVALLVGAHLPFESGWTNSAFLVGANGRILTRYDKAHLYGDDAKYYLAGRARPQSAAVKGALVASVVCFDFRFPEPFRRLALDGAQAIAVPSHVHGRNDMWKGPVVEGHIRSRAAENGRYVIFANAAGAPQNVPSMIADPRGEVVVMARRGPRAFLTATLDLTRVNDDFLSCRRTDLYGK